MLGISLTAEQIRTAPPEVRHWLEQQVAGLFAPVAEEAAQAAPRHLALLNPGDAQAVLEQIEDILPVVSVFFELGRENAGVPVQGVRVFRLAEMLRHTRLESSGAGGPVPGRDQRRAPPRPPGSRCADLRGGP